MSFLKPKCTTFNFECGSAPDPAGRTYSALTEVKGAYLKGRASRGRERRERKGKGLRHGCWGMEAPASSNPVTATIERCYSATF